MSQQRRRRRKPLGRLSAEQLLAHRELEVLRVAARRPRRGPGQHLRHIRHMSVRFAKLGQAQRLAAKQRPDAA